MSQRKLVLFIALSLDGYIATKENSLDWLFAIEGEGDNGFSKFYDTVDTILIGRKTYDWIMDVEKDDFPYKGKECYVFSRTEKDDNEYVKFVNEDATHFAEKLRNKVGNNIWVVGGGELLNAFTEAKLIDELRITIAPILLGKGIPLFKNNDFPTQLSLKSVTKYNQFVELHYEVKNDCP